MKKRLLTILLAAAVVAAAGSPRSRIPAQRAVRDGHRPAAHRPGRARHRRRPARRRSLERHQAARHARRPTEHRAGRDARAAQPEHDRRADHAGPAPEPGPPSAGGGSPQGQTNSGERVNAGAREGSQDHGRASLEPRMRVRASKDKRPRRTASCATPTARPRRRTPASSTPCPARRPRTGVPNFVIRKFRVPLFLLPIYQAAGIQYGIRWEVLAAINEIETDYGRNLNVSSAGALGWMQFIPSTWRMYGVDANKDGKQGPLQPGRRDLRRRPLPQGRRLRGRRAPRDLRLQPRRLVRRLGAAARPADRRRARRPGRLADRADRGPLPRLRPRPLRRRPGRGRAAKRVKQGENAANVVESTDDRRSIDIFARRARRSWPSTTARSRRSARPSSSAATSTLQDVYGNRYTYAHLGSVVAATTPCPRRTPADRERAARRR